MAIRQLEPYRNSAKPKKDGICNLTNNVIYRELKCVQGHYTLLIKCVVVYTMELKGLTPLYHLPIHRGGIKMKSIMW